MSRVGRFRFQTAQFNHGRPGSAFGDTDGRLWKAIRNPSPTVFRARVSGFRVFRGSQQLARAPWRLVRSRLLRVVHRNKRKDEERGEVRTYGGQLPCKPPPADQQQPHGEENRRADEAESCQDVRHAPDSSISNFTSRRRPWRRGAGARRMRARLRRSCGRSALARRVRHLAPI